MPNSAAGTLIGPGNAVIPGPIPGLTLTGTTVIAAGNAAGLFPEITPAPASSRGPGSTAPTAGPGTSPAADAFTAALGTSGLVAQVLGLIALAIAFLLAMTRQSLCRRTNRRGPRA